MKQHPSPESKWESLTGYPLEEAREILDGENVSYTVHFTAPPRKGGRGQEVRVLALRSEDPLVLICAAQDWTVERRKAHGQE